MVSFVGRSNNHILFSDEKGERGVVVDARYGVVVASGKLPDVTGSTVWGDGEFTEPDAQAAHTAFSTALPVPAPTGRLYTIPRGAKETAKRALRERIGTPVSRKMASLLAGGGQIDFNHLADIHRYFATHDELEFEDERALRGGPAAEKWANAIVAREDVAEDPSSIQTFEDILEEDPEASVEFIARVLLDGSGIDRLYKVDLDSSVYLWDGDSWENMGFADQSIWSIDDTLDGQESPFEATHVIIDAESAIILASKLSKDPFGSVLVEDIDTEEASLVLDALEDVDWATVDSTITAAAMQEFANPDDGVYTEDERSANASKQVRDKTGKFAKVGTRIMIAGDAGTTGNITKVDPSDGTVTVALDAGGEVKVPARVVEAAPAATINTTPASPASPQEPVERTRIDTSGILAEPRTPSNRVKAQIPGTLPQMTREDLHSMLANFPAWVKEQRSQFKGAKQIGNTPVQTKDRTDLGPEGKKLQKETNAPFTEDAYDHPLLREWFKKSNGNGVSNNLWYKPITAAAQESDVQPIYMAIVAPDDPRAVLHLVSLVPASPTSTAPMTYVRKDGKWERDPKMLSDLNSATPPPVVPLDSETLQEVLTQVDTNSEPAEEPAPVADPTVAPAAPAPAVTASLALTVLFGPEPIRAAGGLDRNRGNAEKLRRYWTRGAGAAKIRWGTPGDWRRCVRYLGKHMGERAKGYCQLRHKEAVGIYTGDDRNNSIQASAAPTEVTEADLALPIAEIKSEQDDLFDDSWFPEDEIQAILEEDLESIVAAGGLDRNNGGAEKLRRYWTWGKGAAKIRWGSGGDWTRCVRYLGKYMGARAKGYCALRHKEMTGQWTGDKRHRQMYSHRGSEIAFSDKFIVDSEAVIASALLRAKAEAARERMGLVASVEVPVENARFRIPLVLPEEVESGDGRMVADEATIMRMLPLPLMWQETTADGHNGSYVVGRIDHMERIEGGIGNATGVFDLGSAYGREAHRMVKEGFLRGVSADLDKFKANAEEVLSENEADEKDAMVKEERLVIEQARVMGVTIVAKPAFEECSIFLDEEEFPLEEIVTPDVPADPITASALVACAVVASAIPVEPPKDWFKDPQLNKPTPITVTDDGRVFGHIAAWHTDHIGLPNNTKPPRSSSGYAYFHTGVVRTQEGQDVPVGQLTLAGGHASMFASADEAVKHYDDTNSAVADVHAGEDMFGIWVAGGLRPSATPEQIRALRASAPSGDWRPVGRKLELVAVCQVNVPGFPVPRARVASGAVMALVAAGAPAIAQLAGEERYHYERMMNLEAGETVTPLKASLTEEQTEKYLAARAKLEEFANARNERLAAKAAELSARFNTLAPKDSTRALMASAQALKARVASAKDDADRKKREAIEEIAKDVAPEIVEDTPPFPPKAEGTPPAATPGGEGVGDGGAKYTPETQPRDDQGRFRLILARLRDNLGTNGNQAVLDKIKAVENLDNAGNYKQAVESAADLINSIDRIDSGALNDDSLVNIREATTDLGKVVANLPLPFDNQAQKVRFSDLPPALRELFKSFTEKVVAKLGNTEGREATAEVRSFMSGGDVYSQSEISEKLNTMLRLLT